MTPAAGSAVSAPRQRPLPWHDGQIQVLRALHFARRASRRELATQTGLSPGSLTRITQELLAMGFIEELERRRNGGIGQPAIELGILPGRILSLGLVLEDDRITCVLSDLADGVLNRAQAVGRFVTAEETAATAETLIEEVLAMAPTDGALLGLGVSQSGFFFDPAKQRIVALGDVEGWAAMDLGRRFSERFQLDVYIENDGRAAATGHLVHGVGTQFENYFVVLMTHGVGGGGVVDGRLVRGHAGNAGEMPRGKGMRASLRSLAEHLGVPHGDPDFERVVEQALRREDPLMVEWLTVSAAKLENVLVSVCNLLDPEAIIFSGRLPYSVRAALAERIQLSGKSIGDITAPGPSIVVDPAADCLEIGAAALPIAKVFSGLDRRLASGRRAGGAAEEEPSERQGA
jgi:predicted NBD/HSP70 family sugar kinase